MVGRFRRAFIIVGKRRGKKFFIRKTFRTRTAAQRAIERERLMAKRRRKEIRESGREVIPARATARVIQRPRFGFKRR